MYDELVKQLQYCATHDCMHEGEELVGCTAPIEEREGCCTCNDVLMMQAADAIEELSEPRWIPVTERLPENGQDVLVWVSIGKAPLVAYDVDCYNEHAKRWVCFENDVTHWMPLPEPPKEET